MYLHVRKFYELGKGVPKGAMGVPERPWGARQSASEDREGVGAHRRTARGPARAGRQSASGARGRGAREGVGAPAREGAQSASELRESAPARAGLREDVPVRAEGYHKQVTPGAADGRFVVGGWRA